MVAARAVFLADSGTWSYCVGYPYNLVILLWKCGEIRVAPIADPDSWMLGRPGDILPVEAHCSWVEACQTVHDKTQLLLREHRKEVQRRQGSRAVPALPTRSSLPWDPKPTSKSLDTEEGQIPSFSFASRIKMVEQALQKEEAAFLQTDAYRSDFLPALQALDLDALVLLERPNSAWYEHYHGTRAYEKLAHAARDKGPGTKLPTWCVCGLARVAHRDKSEEAQAARCLLDEYRRGFGSDAKAPEGQAVLDDKMLDQILEASVDTPKQQKVLAQHLKNSDLLAIRYLAAGKNELSCVDDTHAAKSAFMNYARTWIFDPKVCKLVFAATLVALTQDHNHAAEADQLLTLFRTCYLAHVQLHLS